jgi:hypothetical protein
MQECLPRTKMRESREECRREKKAGLQGHLGRKGAWVAGLPCPISLSLGTGGRMPAHGGMDGDRFSQREWAVHREGGTGLQNPTSDVRSRDVRR